MEERVEFEIGDEDTIPSRRAHQQRRRSQCGLKWESCLLRSLTRGLAGQTHVSACDAAVQGVLRELPTELQWANEEVMGTQRNNCYPSQSAKTLLKESFEVNSPTHLDFTHQKTGLSSSQMVQLLVLSELKWR